MVLLAVLALGGCGASQAYQIMAEPGEVPNQGDPIDIDIVLWPDAGGDSPEAVDWWVGKRNTNLPEGARCYTHLDIETGGGVREPIGPVSDLAPEVFVRQIGEGRVLVYWKYRKQRGPADVGRELVSGRELGEAGDLRILLWEDKVTVKPQHRNPDRWWPF